jgi:hypothetical protein
LKAVELKLKLHGVIHDRRFSLYTDSPDDDLSTCLFDPREDENPPLEPPAEAPASPAEPPSAEAPTKVDLPPGTPGREMRRIAIPSRTDWRPDDQGSGTQTSSPARQGARHFTPEDHPDIIAKEIQSVLRQVAANPSHASRTAEASALLR